ncbi:MAG: hypothetical protein LHV68_04285 [Elusimicrobia bacterium]|nr:hypothetical protein [Candidatus Liberimonas magnetica]
MLYKKFTAILTTLCFVFSFIVSPPLQAVVERYKEVKDFKKIFDSFVLPAAVGRITDNYGSELKVQSSENKDQLPGTISELRINNSNTVVINIQDLHCHAEVQRNISKILSLLDNKYHLKRVYIEGAAGPVDTSWITQVKDKELKTKVLESLVNGGKLTGAEYYSVLSDRPDLLFGVDDRKLHTDNIIRLNTIENKQKEIMASLDELSPDLDRLKERYYDSKNRKLDNFVLKYKNGNIDPQKYYSDLLEYSQKLNIDTVRFRNVEEFSNTLIIAKELNYKKITRELQSFIVLLKEKLPYSAYKMLAANTVNFTQANQLYVYLARLAKDYDPSLLNDLPNLKKFFNYLDSTKNINPLQLVKEENKLLNEIRLRLALKSSERDIVFLIEFTKSLKEYLSYKITAEDYKFVEENISKFNTLWAQYAGNDKLSQVQPYIALLNEYYNVNIKRNECLLANCNIVTGDSRQGAGVSETALNNSEIASPAARNDTPLVIARSEATKQANSNSQLDSSNLLENAENIVVVITGGFHTPGLSELLKEKNIPYLVITPNVTQDVGFAENTYSELLKLESAMLAKDPKVLGFLPGVFNDIAGTVKQELAFNIIDFSNIKLASEHLNSLQLIVLSTMAGFENKATIVSADFIRDFIVNGEGKAGERIAAVNKVLGELFGENEKFKILITPADDGNYELQIVYVDANNKTVAVTRTYDSKGHLLSIDDKADKNAVKMTAAPNVDEFSEKNEFNAPDQVRQSVQKEINKIDEEFKKSRQPAWKSPIWRTYIFWAALETLTLGVLTFIPVTGLLRTAAFGAITVVFVSIHLIQDIQEYNKGHITKQEVAKNFFKRLGGAVLIVFLPFSFLKPAAAIAVSFIGHGVWNTIAVYYKKLPALAAGSSATSAARTQIKQADLEKQAKKVLDGFQLRNNVLLGKAAAVCHPEPLEFAKALKALGKLQYPADAKKPWFMAEVYTPIKFDGYFRTLQKNIEEELGSTRTDLSEIIIPLIIPKDVKVDYVNLAGFLRSITEKEYYGRVMFAIIFESEPELYEFLYPEAVRGLSPMHPDRQYITEETGYSPDRDISVSRVYNFIRGKDASVHYDTTAAATLDRTAGQETQKTPILALPAPAVNKLIETLKAFGTEYAGKRTLYDSDKTLGGLDLNLQTFTKMFNITSKGLMISAQIAAGEDKVTVTLNENKSISINFGSKIKGVNIDQDVYMKEYPSLKRIAEMLYASQIPMPAPEQMQRTADPKAWAMAIIKDFDAVFQEAMKKSNNQDSKLVQTNLNENLANPVVGPILLKIFEKMQTEITGMSYEQLVWEAVTRFNANTEIEDRGLTFRTVSAGDWVIINDLFRTLATSVIGYTDMIRLVTDKTSQKIFIDKVTDNLKTLLLVAIVWKIRSNLKITIEDRENGFDFQYTPVIERAEIARILKLQKAAKTPDASPEAKQEYETALKAFLDAHRPEGKDAISDKEWEKRSAELEKGLGFIKKSMGKRALKAAADSLGEEFSGVTNLSKAANAVVAILALSEKDKKLIQDKLGLSEGADINPALADLIVKSINSFMSVQEISALTLEELANISAHTAWNLTHKKEERLSAVKSYTDDFRAYDFEKEFEKFKAGWTGDVLSNPAAVEQKINNLSVILEEMMSLNKPASEKLADLSKIESFIQDLFRRPNIPGLTSDNRSFLGILWDKTAVARRNLNARQQQANTDTNAAPAPVEAKVEVRKDRPLDRVGGLWDYIEELQQTGNRKELEMVFRIIMVETNGNSDPLRENYTIEDIKKEINFVVKYHRPSASYLLDIFQRHGMDSSYNKQIIHNFMKACIAEPKGHDPRADGLKEYIACLELNGETEKLDMALKLVLSEVENDTSILAREEKLTQEEVERAKTRLYAFWAFKPLKKDLIDRAHRSERYTALMQETIYELLEALLVEPKENDPRAERLKQYIAGLESEGDAEKLDLALKFVLTATEKNMDILRSKKNVTDLEGDTEQLNLEIRTALEEAKNKLNMFNKEYKLTQEERARAKSRLYAFWAYQPEVIDLRERIKYEDYTPMKQIAEDIIAVTRQKQDEALAIPLAGNPWQSDPSRLAQVVDRVRQSAKEGLRQENERRRIIEEALAEPRRKLELKRAEKERLAKIERAEERRRQAKKDAREQARLNKALALIDEIEEQGTDATYLDVPGLKADISGAFSSLILAAEKSTDDVEKISYYVKALRVAKIENLSSVLKTVENLFGSTDWGKRVVEAYRKKIIKEESIDLRQLIMHLEFISELVEKDVSMASNEFRDNMVDAYKSINRLDYDEAKYYCEKAINFAELWNLPEVFDTLDSIYSSESLGKELVNAYSDKLDELIVEGRQDEFDIRQMLDRVHNTRRHIEGSQRFATLLAHARTYLNGSNYFRAEKFCREAVPYIEPYQIPALLEFLIDELYLDYKPARKEKAEFYRKVFREMLINGKEKKFDIQKAFRIIDSDLPLPDEIEFQYSPVRERIKIAEILMLKKAAFAPGASDKDMRDYIEALKTFINAHRPQGSESISDSEWQKRRFKLLKGILYIENSTNETALSAAMKILGEEFYGAKNLSKAVTAVVSVLLLGLGKEDRQKISKRLGIGGLVNLNSALTKFVLNSINLYMSPQSISSLTIEDLANISAHSIWNLTHKKEERLSLFSGDETQYGSGQGDEQLRGQNRAVLYDDNTDIEQAINDIRTLLSSNSPDENWVSLKEQINNMFSINITSRQRGILSGLLSQVEAKIAASAPQAQAPKKKKGWWLGISAGTVKQILNEVLNMAKINTVVSLSDLSVKLAEAGLSADAQGVRYASHDETGEVSIEASAEALGKLDKKIEKVISLDIVGVLEKSINTKEQNYQALKSLLAYCKENGIKIVITSTKDAAPFIEILNVMFGLEGTEITILNVERGASKLEVLHEMFPEADIIHIDDKETLASKGYFAAYGSSLAWLYNLAKNEMSVNSYIERHERMEFRALKVSGVKSAEEAQGEAKVFARYLETHHKELQFKHATDELWHECVKAVAQEAQKSKVQTGRFNVWGVTIEDAGPYISDAKLINAMEVSIIDEIINVMKGMVPAVASANLSAEAVLAQLTNAAKSGTKADVIGSRISFLQVYKDLVPRYDRAKSLLLQKFGTVETHNVNDNEKKTVAELLEKIGRNLRNLEYNLKRDFPSGGKFEYCSVFTANAEMNIRYLEILYDYLTNIEQKDGLASALKQDGRFVDISVRVQLYKDMYKKQKARFEANEDLIIQNDTQKQILTYTVDAIGKQIEKAELIVEQAREAKSESEKDRLIKSVFGHLNTVDELLPGLKSDIDRKLRIEYYIGEAENALDQMAKHDTQILKENWLGKSVRQVVLDALGNMPVIREALGRDLALVALETAKDILPNITKIAPENIKEGQKDRQITFDGKAVKIRTYNGKVIQSQTMEGVAGLATLEADGLTIAVSESFWELWDSWVPANDELMVAVKHEFREADARQGEDTGFNKYLGVFKAGKSARNLDTKEFVKLYHAYIEAKAGGEYLDAGKNETAEQFLLETKLIKKAESVIDEAEKAYKFNAPETVRAVLNSIPGVELSENETTSLDDLLNSYNITLDRAGGLRAYIESLEKSGNKEKLNKALIIIKLGIDKSSYILSKKENIDVKRIKSELNVFLKNQPKKDEIIDIFKRHTQDCDEELLDEIMEAYITEPKEHDPRADGLKAYIAGLEGDPDKLDLALKMVLAEVENNINILARKEKLTPEEIVRTKTRLYAFWALRPYKYNLFPKAVESPAIEQISDELLEALITEPKEHDPRADGLKAYIAGLEGDPDKLDLALKIVLAEVERKTAILGRKEKLTPEEITRAKTRLYAFWGYQPIQIDILEMARRAGASSPASDQIIYELMAAIGKKPWKMDELGRRPLDKTSGLMEYIEELEKGSNPRKLDVVLDLIAEVVEGSSLFVHADKDRVKAELFSFLAHRPSKESLTDIVRKYSQDTDYMLGIIDEVLEALIKEPKGHDPRLDGIKEYIAGLEEDPEKLDSALKLVLAETEQDTSILKSSHKLTDAETARAKTRLYAFWAFRPYKSDLIIKAQQAKVYSPEVQEIIDGLLDSLMREPKGHDSRAHRLKEYISGLEENQDKLDLALKIVLAEAEQRTEMLSNNNKLTDEEIARAKTRLYAFWAFRPYKTDIVERAKRAGITSPILDETINELMYAIGQKLSAGQVKIVPDLVKSEWENKSLIEKLEILKSILYDLEINGRADKFPKELLTIGDEQLNVSKEKLLDLQEKYSINLLKYEKEIVDLYGKLEAAPRIEAGELMNLTWLWFTQVFNPGKYADARAAFMKAHKVKYRENDLWTWEMERDLNKIISKTALAGLLGGLVGIALSVMLGLLASTYFMPLVNLLDIGGSGFNVISAVLVGISAGLTYIFGSVLAYNWALKGNIYFHRQVNVQARFGEELTKRTVKRNLGITAQKLNNHLEMYIQKDETHLRSAEQAATEDWQKDLVKAARLVLEEQWQEWRNNGTNKVFNETLGVYAWLEAIKNKERYKLENLLDFVAKTSELYIANFHSVIYTLDNDVLKLGKIVFYAKIEAMDNWRELDLEIRNTALAQLGVQGLGKNMYGIILKILGPVAQVLLAGKIQEIAGNMGFAILAEIPKKRVYIKQNVIERKIVVDGVEYPVKIRECKGDILYVDQTTVGFATINKEESAKGSIVIDASQGFFKYFTPKERVTGIIHEIKESIARKGGNGDFNYYWLNEKYRDIQSKKELDEFDSLVKDPEQLKQLVAGLGTDEFVESYHRYLHHIAKVKPEYADESALIKKSDAVLARIIARTTFKVDDNMRKILKYLFPGMDFTDIVETSMYSLAGKNISAEQRKVVDRNIAMLKELDIQALGQTLEGKNWFSKIHVYIDKSGKIISIGEKPEQETLELTLNIKRSNRGVSVKDFSFSWNEPLNQAQYTMVTETERMLNLDSEAKKTIVELSKTNGTSEVILEDSKTIHLLIKDRFRSILNIENGKLFAVTDRKGTDRGDIESKKLQVPSNGKNFKIGNFVLNVTRIGKGYFKVRISLADNRVGKSIVSITNSKADFFQKIQISEDGFAEELFERFEKKLSGDMQIVLEPKQKNLPSSLITFKDGKITSCVPGPKGDEYRDLKFDTTYDFGPLGKIWFDNDNGEYSIKILPKADVKVTFIPDYSQPSQAVPVAGGALTAEATYKKGESLWEGMSLKEKLEVLKRILSDLKKNGKEDKFPKELLAIADLSDSSLDETVEQSLVLGTKLFNHKKELIALYSELEVAPQVEAPELMELTKLWLTQVFNKDEYENALKAFKNAHKVRDTEQNRWSGSMQEGLNKIIVKTALGGFLGGLIGVSLAVAAGLVITIIFAPLAGWLDMGAIGLHVINVLSIVASVKVAFKYVFTLINKFGLKANIQIHRQVNIEAGPGQALTEQSDAVAMAVKGGVSTEVTRRRFLALVFGTLAFMTLACVSEATITPEPAPVEPTGVPSNPAATTAPVAPTKPAPQPSAPADSYTPSKKQCTIDKSGIQHRPVEVIIDAKTEKSIRSVVNLSPEQYIQKHIVKINQILAASGANVVLEVMPIRRVTSLTLEQRRPWTAFDSGGWALRDGDDYAGFHPDALRNGYDYLMLHEWMHALVPFFDDYLFDAKADIPGVPPHKGLMGLMYSFDLSLTDMRGYDKIPAWQVKLLNRRIKQGLGYTGTMVNGVQMITNPPFTKEDIPETIKIQLDKSLGLAVNVYETESDPKVVKRTPMFSRATDAQGAFILDRAKAFPDIMKEPDQNIEYAISQLGKGVLLIETIKDNKTKSYYWLDLPALIAAKLDGKTTIQLQPVYQASAPAPGVASNLGVGAVAPAILSKTNKKTGDETGGKPTLTPNQKKRIINRRLDSILQRMDQEKLTGEELERLSIELQSIRQEVDEDNDYDNYRHSLNKRITKLEDKLKIHRQVNIEAAPGEALASSVSGLNIKSETPVIAEARVSVLAAIRTYKPQEIVKEIVKRIIAQASGLGTKTVFIADFGMANEEEAKGRAKAAASSGANVIRVGFIDPEAATKEGKLTKLDVNGEDTMIPGIVLAGARTALGLWVEKTESALKRFICQHVSYLFKQPLILIIVALNRHFAHLLENFFF